MDSFSSLEILADPIRTDELSNTACSSIFVHEFVHSILCPILFEFPFLEFLLVHISACLTVSEERSLEGRGDDTHVARKL